AWKNFVSTSARRAGAATCASQRAPMKMASSIFLRHHLIPYLSLQSARLFWPASHSARVILTRTNRSLLLSEAWAAAVFQAAKPRHHTPARIDAGNKAKTHVNKQTPVTRLPCRHTVERPDNT